MIGVDAKDVLGPTEASGDWELFGGYEEVTRGVKGICFLKLWRHRNTCLAAANLPLPSET